MINFRKIVLAFAVLIPCKVWATINVVVVAPQEGEEAFWGRELSDGVKIAATEINSQGGILGQKINVIVADDRCDDTYAVTMAQMLSVKKESDDKISLVIGPYCRNKLVEVSDIYANSKIIQIMPLPVGDNEQNSNSIAGLRKNQANAFFEFYKNNVANQNVALAYDPQKRDAIDIATELQNLFDSHGKINKLTVYSFIDFGNNYVQMAREILLNNKLVFIVADDEDSIELKKAIQKLNKQAKVFVERYKLKEQIKEDDGQYYLGLKSFKDSPYFTETLVKLRLQGNEPVGLGIYGFTALKFWTESINEAKSFEYDKIKTVMNNLITVMPWGKIKGIRDKIPLLYGVFEKKGEEYTQVK